MSRLSHRRSRNQGAASRSIDVAKVKLPLPMLLARLGLGKHAKRSARCPFHDDHRNSFSIWQRDGAWFWKCHAHCGSGDEITLLEKHKGISNKQAVKLFLEFANGSAPSPQTLARESNSEEPTPFNWQTCVDAFSEEHLSRLADWRGFSGEFCSWAVQKALVGLHDGRIAFPVHDCAGNVIAAHYRLKDGSWRYHPGGAKTRPLVIGELVPGDTVHIFESQWDAFAFMDAGGERHGIIITRGASNGALVASLIPEGSSAYLWTQNDAAGDKWQKDICANTKTVLKRARIPAPHKDLNDWTRAGATDKDLLDAIVNAETLREAEKSWTQALKESVVTSRELRDLALAPRKKLLGDWFAEGDLGFIFAFRGVGKTWLALAIAQALSTAGKLGEWQAHEHVRVLYVDGEMPPDLMRDRAQGLEKGNDELEFLNHLILFERTGRVLNIANREVQQALTAHCIANAVKVLILDNLSTLASGMKENEADSWELLNAWLLDLRRRKIAVVIVHHAGRSGEMRGTSKREDNVFWIIALDDAKKNAEDKRGARFVSRFTKPSRNTQEDVAAFEWHFVTEPNGEVSISHKLAQTMDVFLGLIGDGVNECTAISEEMKISKPSVSRMAKQAEAVGKIIIKSRRYFLEEGAKNEPKL
jgi:AAA domain/CHC2 zinc finger